jgi:hypothetical protein
MIINYIFFVQTNKKPDGHCLSFTLDVSQNVAYQFLYISKRDDTNLIDFYRVLFQQKRNWRT